MEESTFILHSWVSVTMWMFTIGLCLRYKDWRRRGPVLASLVMMLLLFGLMMYSYYIACSPCFKHKRDVAILTMWIILYLSDILYLGVLAFGTLWYFQGLDGSSLWSTWLKERKMFKARKEWSRAVEEFGRIETVSRDTISLDGLDYGEYFRRRYGLAEDDPYFVKHYRKLSTKHDRDLRRAREYEQLVLNSTESSALSYSSSNSRNGYHPDDWRKDIPYSDPFDSHLSASAPEHLDRDGDGYIDGTVGDGGYES